MRYEYVILTVTEDTLVKLTSKKVGASDEFNDCHLRATPSTNCITCVAKQKTFWKVLIAVNTER